MKITTVTLLVSLLAVGCGSEISGPDSSKSTLADRNCVEFGATITATVDSTLIVWEDSAQRLTVLFAEYSSAQNDYKVGWAERILQFDSNWSILSNEILWWVNRDSVEDALRKKNAFSVLDYQQDASVHLEPRGEFPSICSNSEYSMNQIDRIGKSGGPARFICTAHGKPPFGSEKDYFLLDVRILDGKCQIGLVSGPHRLISFWMKGFFSESRNEQVIFSFCFAPIHSFQSLGLSISHVLI